MRLSLTLAALLLAAALSGCTGDDDPPELTDEMCAEQGLILGEHHVMDNETGEHHTEPACVEAGPPATVTIEGLPATSPAYAAASFQWVLGTGAEEAHTMRTEVRFDDASVADDALGRADDWGSSIALKEHQNFVDGTAFEATFAPEEPGTYYIRAFALVDNTNIWSEEYVMEVTPPEPTGTTHTVSVSGGGLPAGGLDPEGLTITLGDAVEWVNGDPLPLASYGITSVGGPESFSTTAGGDAVVFLIPGNYAYTASAEGGSYSGTITVTAP